MATRKRSGASSAPMDIDAFLNSDSDAVPTTVAAAGPALASTTAQVPAGGFPEDTMSEDEVILALEQTEPELTRLNEELTALQERKMRLYKRYQQFRDADMSQFGLNINMPGKDKRSIENPVKNLKISIRRAFGWADHFGQKPDEAKQRAIEAALKSAQENYAKDPTLAPYLENNQLPPELMEFIELRAKEYAAAKKKKHAA